MGLKRTVAPEDLAVTQEEAKRHLSIVTAQHDDHITHLIKAATEAAERYTGRAIVTQTWRLTLDAFPCKEIRIPRPPLQSVTSIEYIDQDGTLQELDDSLYNATTDAEPARIEPAYGEVWPVSRCEREAVRVTYVAGYGANATSTPDALRHAILLMVGQWFSHREPTISGTTIAEVPMSVKWLLDGFKTGAGAEWYGLVG